MTAGSLATTTYGATQVPIAQWEDLQYSVILSRTPFLNGFPARHMFEAAE